MSTLQYYTHSPLTIGVWPQATALCYRYIELSFNHRHFKTTVSNDLEPTYCLRNILNILHSNFHAQKVLGTCATQIIFNSTSSGKLGNGYINRHVNFLEERSIQFNSIQFNSIQFNLYFHTIKNTIHTNFNTTKINNIWRSNQKANEARKRLPLWNKNS